MAAVFLDRDGVLVEPVRDPALGTWESPYRAEDVALVPGAAAALRALRAAGFLLVLASNQPAAAKGTVTLSALRAVHDCTLSLLAEEGASLDDSRYCLHHPTGAVPEHCDCRKPAPGLLLEAARDHHIDLTASWMIGDSDSDVLAGQAAGTSTILIEHPRTAHRRTGASTPTLRAADLMLATVLVGTHSQNARRPDRLSPATRTERTHA